MAEKKSKWVVYHTNNHRVFEKIERGEQILKDGKPLDRNQVAILHRISVDNMLKEGHAHTMVDALDRTLPKYMTDRSSQKNVLWCDVFSKERDVLMRAITTLGSNVLVPMSIKNEILWAFYVSPPHGQWIWEGSKKSIIKSMVFKHHILEPLLLVSGNHAYGVITLGAAVKITQGEFNAMRHSHKIGKAEAVKLGFDKQEDIYSYDVKMLHAYPQPIEVDHPRGMQTFAKASEIRVLKNQPAVSIMYGDRELDNIFFAQDTLTAAFGF